MILQSDINFVHSQENLHYRCSSHSHTAPGLYCNATRLASDHSTKHFFNGFSFLVLVNTKLILDEMYRAPPVCKVRMKLYETEAT